MTTKNTCRADDEMFEIRRYTADDRKSWDGYVRRARNATFLFERN